MESTTRNVLAKRVRTLRSALGWSQEVLAYLSKLNRSYIGAIERCEHNIGLDNIEKIASAFEVSVVDLISTPQTLRITELMNKRKNRHSAAVDQDISAHTASTDCPRDGASISKHTFSQLILRCPQGQHESIFDYLQLRGVAITE